MVKTRNTVVNTEFLGRKGVALSVSVGYYALTGTTRWMSVGDSIFLINLRTDFRPIYRKWPPRTETVNFGAMG